MRSLLLISLSFFIFLSNAANLGCKRFEDSSWSYLTFSADDLFSVSADVIGVCLATYLTGTTDGVTTTYTSSQQYVCEDNGDGGYNVVSKSYTNADCTQDDETTSETVQTDQDLIDCESPGCPIYEWRLYDAEEDGDSCTKEESYTEGVVLVDVCVFGWKWVCDTYNDGITQENYHKVSLFDGIVYDPTCNATEPQSTTTIVNAGCGSISLGVFDDYYGYLETQACSGVNTYSILIISILSVIFYVLSL